MNLPRVFSVVLFFGLMASAQAQLSWSQRALPRDGHLDVAVFGAQKFVATVNGNGYQGGGGGHVAYSSDGSSWRLAALPGSVYYLASTGSNHFLAAGDDGFYASTNGYTWTTLTGLPFLEYLDDVVYSNGKYLILGPDSDYDDSLVYSTNATFSAWTQKKINITASISTVSWGKNVFVASARSSGTSAFYTSPDGATWTKQTVSGTGRVNKIRYLDNRFVAVGSGGAIYTSYDTVTWTKRPTPCRDALFDVCFGKGTLVAVGSGGIILTSIDHGVSWVTSPTGVWSSLTGAAFGNDKFLVTGSYEAVLQSN